jgi:probable phosphoglycerate mutase
LGLIGAVASVWFVWVWERVTAGRRLTWRFTEKVVARIAGAMAADGFLPTLIVGIGRGGAVMGALISGALGHRPFVVIDRKYTWQEGRRRDDILLKVSFPQALLDSVLLVAGEVHSGNTMRLYFDYFQDLGAQKIARASLLVQKGATEPVEYIGKVSKRDLRLPWMFSREYRRDSLSEEEARALEALSGSRDGMYGQVRRVCFLVRHGESTDNAAGDRFSGVSNAGLTDRGLRQAKATGVNLQGQGIDRIYSSPMRRALSTARDIQARAGGVLLTDERLREMDYGEWEGVTRRDVHNRWRSEYLAWRRDPVEHAPPSSLDNGSITRLLVQNDGTAAIVSENCTGHLRDISQ